MKTGKHREKIWVNFALFHILKVSQSYYVELRQSNSLLNADYLCLHLISTFCRSGVEGASKHAGQEHGPHLGDGYGEWSRSGSQI